MDFMNRGNRPAQTPHNPVQNGFPGNQDGDNKKSGKFSSLRSLRIVSIALLFSATVLIVALIVFMVTGNTKSESRFVSEDRLQAVFLNGGQVYFGKIDDINDKYLRLSNIFYLRVNQQVQPEQGQGQATDANDISLVKLGCELHRPTNEMLINRDQVVFWENLKEDDGQNTVPGAVVEYLKQYPNGQDCEEQAAQQQDNTQQTNPTGTEETQNNDTDTTTP